MAGLAQLSVESLAQVIDHTLLKPESSQDEVKKLCDDAMRYHFATVCVNPIHIQLAADLLSGSEVKAITVVGFPLGANTLATKIFETKNALELGAQELDMVLNIGALKQGLDEVVFEEIESIVRVARGVPVKVIIETALLTNGEKIRACTLSRKAGAAFVKTSTGFSKGGATVEDIQLMRKTVGPEMGVKASGGIRNLEDAVKMIQAGANRLGASASVTIIEEAKKGGLIRQGTRF